MGRKKTALAPAKINLYLEVLGRRSDGYHEIRSIMVPVSLFDEVTVEVTERDEVMVLCDHPSLKDRPNLAGKAAELFIKRMALNSGVRIFLEKHIPVSAGLGGGSSDAATVLTLLNELFGHLLGHQDLEELALNLGADVPFFIERKPCLAEGIGERLSPLKIEDKLWFLLVNPGVEVSTAQVYGNLNLELTKRPVDTILPSSIEGPLQVRNLLRNDLEMAAKKVCPKIGEVKDYLRSLGAEAILVSGSGPTVFYPLPERSEGERFSRHIGEKTDWSCFLVHSI